MEFTLDTTEKVVSAIAGIIAIGGFAFYRLRNSPDKEAPQASNVASNTQHVNVTIGPSPAAGLGAANADARADLSAMNIPDLKRCVRILFIDDDRGFKIVDVLKKMGWEHTRILGDVASLEAPTVLEADVVFVDIQGVGKAMRYTDEGLGLALALKRRHPTKKVIIYSAHEEGSRFHEALQEADYSLPKTADPIRFEETIVRVLRA